MLASLVPSPLWQIAPKQRLTQALTQAPARTRVAPSPTGHVHLGTVRTALHNFLAARASGGSFLLRIDDTDASRNDDANVIMIHQALAALGLGFDATFAQSSKRDSHAAAAKCLLDAGWTVQDGPAVRLAPKARDLAPASFFDLANGVCQVSSTFLNQADGLVLVRSDGTPTYQFASVVDDIDAQITLIIRGMDHLANVAKQVIVARALAASDYPNAQVFCNSVLFAHVGLILKDGKKLSKRDNASHLSLYLDQVCPQAFLQWALPLGWGHPDPQWDKTHPLVSLDQMSTFFMQGGLRGANCSMDTKKLDALDRKWKAALA